MGPKQDHPALGFVRVTTLSIYTFARARGPDWIGFHDTHFAKCHFWNVRFRTFDTFFQNVSGPNLAMVRKWVIFDPQNGPKMAPGNGPHFQAIPGPSLGPQIGPTAPKGVPRQGSKYGPILAPKMVPKWTNFRPPKWGVQNGHILSTFWQDPIRSPDGSRDPGPRKITQGAFFVLMPLDPKIGMCPKMGSGRPK